MTSVRSLLLVLTCCGGDTSRFVVMVSHQLNISIRCSHTELLSFFKFIFKKLFIHLFIIFGCTSSLLLHTGCSSCGELGLLFALVSGHLIVVASLLGSSWALELHSATQWLVESSWTRDRTCVPSIGRKILYHWNTREGFPGGTSGKETAWQCRTHELKPWVRQIPWKMAWRPTPVFLPGECHGQRRLVGYNP